MTHNNNSNTTSRSNCSANGSSNRDGNDNNGYYNEKDNNGNPNDYDQNEKTTIATMIITIATYRNKSNYAYNGDSKNDKGSGYDNLTI